MVNQADVYQHFRKSEAPFVAQVLDWIEQAQVEYRPILTAFLDPRQAFILQTLVGEKGTSVITLMADITLLNGNGQ